MSFAKMLCPFVLAGLVALPGCGSNQEDHSRHADHPQKLTIEFTTNPKEIQPGKEVELIARVSKGSEPVKDADVDLEIWRDGTEKHEMLETKPDKKGAYHLKKTFPEAGLYHVTIHTTTSEIHQMPTVDFQVGQSTGK
ncbi:FixH family protein [Effusibacillus consociatus]|uniref:FixH family protein n=1 Tax=Effusibacillus consociatus TaxID=1117041 RepID=A0ABV9PX21_9BACL